MKSLRIRWTISSSFLYSGSVDPIAGDQPSPASASALTRTRDGCDFLAKNAPSSIAAFSTGICNRASSALMPSGRSRVSKMKSNSIATSSMVIASSCVDLRPSGDSWRSRRTLCLPSGIPEKRTAAPPTSKSTSPRCRRWSPSPSSGVAMIGVPGTYPDAVGGSGPEGIQTLRDCPGISICGSPSPPSAYAGPACGRPDACWPA